MEILMAQALAGKDPVVTLDSMVEAVGTLVAISQVPIPWMDLMDTVGGGNVQTGIRKEAMKSKTLGLKNTGTSARSRGGEKRVRKATI